MKDTRERPRFEERRGWSPGDYLLAFLVLLVALVMVVCGTFLVWALMVNQMLHGR